MKAQVSYVALNSFDALGKPKRTSPIVDADEDDWGALPKAAGFRDQLKFPVVSLFQRYVPPDRLRCKTKTSRLKDLLIQIINREGGKS